jgi:serine/threonine protein kinase
MARGAADLTIGSDFAGYRIDSLLGRGGMGAVYAATHLQLDRRAALKVLLSGYAADDAFRERFIRESRLAAALDHPNIVPIYDAGEAQEVLYLTMRYVQGEDLRTVLERGGPLPPEQALRVITQTGSALDSAHAAGLVHRDVKPANILIGQPDSWVYLTDFGVAKQVGAATSATGTGQWVGTMDYLAPEQISGVSVDGAVDIYAATSVVCHCLTGQVPFPRENEAAQLWAHVNARPPAPSQLIDSLPVAIDPVIARGMAKDPRDRYRSATELAHACSVALGVPIPDSAPTAGPPSSRLPATGAVAPTAVSE